MQEIIHFNHAHVICVAVCLNAKQRLRDSFLTNLFKYKFSYTYIYYTIIVPFLPACANAIATVYLRCLFIQSNSIITAYWFIILLLPVSQKLQLPILKYLYPSIIIYNYQPYIITWGTQFGLKLKRMNCVFSRLPTYISILYLFKLSFLHLYVLTFITHTLNNSLKFIISNSNQFTTKN